MEKRQPNDGPKRRGRPTTPEARERRMIALAMDEAERQIKEGRASSQVLTHFIKLGTVREELERAKIERENRLLEARVQQIADGDRYHELLERATQVFTGYQGHRHPALDEDIDDD